MASIMLKNNELTTFFGKCRCCSKYGYLKSLWTRHVWDGDIEIYGNMLIQCFGISLTLPGLKSLGNEQICNTCVERLRDAFLFKKQVLAIHEQLLEEPEEAVDNTENDNFKVMHRQGKLQECSQIERTNVHFSDDSDDMKEETLEEYDDDIYEEVEYLDDDTLCGADDIGTALGMDSGPSEPQRRFRQPVTPNPNGKWPRKLPKDQRNKTYKQYTKTAMQNAIEAVVDNRLNVMYAANKYHVPDKTLKVKVQQYIMDQETASYKDDQQENFIEEIRAILTYTNATPFKSKGVKYFCPYCKNINQCQYKPKELRKHMIIEHGEDKLRDIPDMLRPAWLNEILKLDIQDLACTVCPCTLNNWNDMFKHLKVHSINLDQAYTKIVPYILNQDLKCALCFEKFTNFMMLDCHMNAHYNNYMCDECGDTFLTNIRLKQHRIIHLSGRFPCRICGKVFSIPKYRKKHEDGHSKLINFKCKYCSEVFKSDHKRHVHVVEKHKEYVKVYTCDQCGKQYDYRLYYLKHVKNHLRTFAYSCKYCNKKYRHRCNLKKHLERCSK